MKAPSASSTPNCQQNSTAGWVDYRGDYKHDCMIKVPYVHSKWEVKEKIGKHKYWTMYGTSATHVHF